MTTVGYMYRYDRVRKFKVMCWDNDARVSWYKPNYSFQDCGPRKCNPKWVKGVKRVSYNYNHDSCPCKYKEASSIYFNEFTWTLQCPGEQDRWGFGPECSGHEGSCW